MEDLEEKISSVLNNPQQLSQILSIAKNLGLTPSDAEGEPTEEAPQTHALPELLKHVNVKDDKQAALLKALKPYLKPEKRAKLERAVQLAKFSGLAEQVLKYHQKDENG